MPGLATRPGDPGPGPPAFTARSLSAYDVPSSSPVTTSGDVSAGCVRGTHVVPPSIEYSTFSAANSGSVTAGAVNATVRVPGEGLTDSRVGGSRVASHAVACTAPYGHCSAAQATVAEPVAAISTAGSRMVTPGGDRRSAAAHPEVRE